MNLVDKNEIDIHKKLLRKTEQNLIIILYECPPPPLHPINVVTSLKRGKSPWGKGIKGDCLEEV